MAATAAGGVSRTAELLVTYPSLPHDYARPVTPRQVVGGVTIPGREPFRGRGNGGPADQRSSDRAAQLRPAGRDQRLLVRRRRPLAADLYRPDPRRGHVDRWLQRRSP